jgi:Protein of unknown function (DUF1328)
MSACRQWIVPPATDQDIRIAGAAGIAKILFVVFLIGAVITLFVGRSRV